MANFKETYDKINESKAFQQFKQDHPDAKIVAGFFILDFQSNDTKSTLDYMDGEKVFTFQLFDDGGVAIKEDKLIESKSSDQPKLTPIEPNIKVELDELKSIIGTRKLDEGINATINKIIAVLQNHEGKLTWNLTCMLDQLIIIHALIDAKTGEIVKFERKNMMDFIKKK